ncbi:3-deoxy-7-phosphoheptulonate synthase [Psychromonas sp. Urea-02u-13]|uniref:3-deoxy-7-phosphoheptulonate synthase n=1 Tax=Psychromonas sp. Urea-02u-13 TaxID=2058326 RepID=UPI000C3426ED|nr:3-deoxy-7-phosphoheptulonate synthase [Psychromonas sp. Urea-02u-13]PKG40091.1 3-deoxy-7-phosphoheptulonate synthase [Psychromonas sp. Urea-02u-13]
MKMLENIINASSVMLLPSLESIQRETRLNEQLQQFIEQQRAEIKSILLGEDPRLLVIIGPCSIHDPHAAIEYATRLVKMQKQYRGTLKLVMRTYFEKPRTRAGWKGFIVTPDLNSEFNFLQGVTRSRQLMKSILELGMPIATEFLDTNIAPYIADMVCWGAIGARTTESQPHRQLASGLHCPIGFKNGTDGNVSIAIDAIHAAKDRHLVLAQSENNQTFAVETQGNDHCHIILRGGATPNYSSRDVKNAAYHLQYSHLTPRLVVDCSHGNSGKIAKNQLSVADNIAEQMMSGEKSIAGVMCESFLLGGNQKINLDGLNYGQSITDECLCWDDTLVFLECVSKAIEHRHSKAKKQAEVA